MRNTFRKIILTVLLLVLCVVCLFDFVNFKESVVEEIEEIISSLTLVITCCLFFIGCLGFTYKNKDTFFKLFVKLSLWVCYSNFLSILIIQDKDSISWVGFSIFIGAFLLLLFVDELGNAFNKIYKRFKSCRNEQKKGGVSLDGGNRMAPTNHYTDLFNDRKSQADRLIYFLQHDDCNEGYSICISGEWGTGKTSFVNGILEKMKETPETGRVEEIRINAMALDDLRSLIYYFFGRIKDILKVHDVYVGINSEYQQLITSLVGILTKDRFTTLVKNKISEKNDYRNMIHQLNFLLTNYLEKSKILVVVDDLDRCDKNKIMEYLFLIKELTSLKCCRVFFLVDYKQLLEKTKQQDLFFEKFFDEKINLCSVKWNDIIRHSLGENTFYKEIESFERFLFLSFEKIKEKHKTSNNDNKSNSSYEKELNSAKNAIDLFGAAINNPRRLYKMHQKYAELKSLCEEYAGSNEYQNFLNKVNYEQQILFLAFVYGAYPQKYAEIEQDGIYVFIDSWKNLKRDGDELDLFDCLIKKEWNYPLSSYIISEKLRFVSYLLSKPKELPSISNGFTSLQEKYVKEIRAGRKPENATFAAIFKEIIYAEYNSGIEKKQCIEALISLFSDISMDDLINTFRSEIRYYSADTLFLLEILYQNRYTRRLINPHETLESYNVFAANCVRNCFQDFTLLISLRYFSVEVNDYTSFSDVIYNQKNCADMCNAYLKTLNKTFPIEINFNEEIVCNFKSLYGNIYTYFEQQEIINSPDIQNYFSDAKSVIESIKIFLELEKFFQDSASNLSANYRIYGNNLSEKLKSAIDYIQNKSISDKRDISIEIENLFIEIANASNSVSNVDLRLMNQVIEKYYEKFGYGQINCRKIYMRLINKQ